MTLPGDLVRYRAGRGFDAYLHLVGRVLEAAPGDGRWRIAWSVLEAAPGDRWRIAWSDGVIGEKPEAVLEPVECGAGGAPDPCFVAVARILARVAAMRLNGTLPSYLPLFPMISRG